MDKVRQGSKRLQTLEKMSAQAVKRMPSDFTEISVRDYNASNDAATEENKSICIDTNCFLRVLKFVSSHLRDYTRSDSRILNSLFYLIDFDYYEIYEKSFMGQLYFKTDNGPISEALERTISFIMTEQAGETISFSDIYERSDLLDKYFTKGRGLSREQELFILSQMNRYMSLKLDALLEYVKSDVPYVVADIDGLIDYWHVDSRGPEHSRCGYVLS